ncbi:MAG: aminotransferase class V-fold PLP-dependent enzyme [Lentimicrobiaceae bacterium]|jgi:selenocysteine lyase/cysteine desulfurase
MKTILDTKNELPETLQQNEVEKGTPRNNEKVEAFAELERGMYAALETYSNVNRGSGHNSMVTTQLFEQARDFVLKYLNLNKGRYVVIFCTPRRAAVLMKLIKPENYQIVSSLDMGLSLGVRAMAVKRKALPGGAPFHSGGGTTRLVSKDWVIWANAPDKFEAGTPAIVNIIAFAKALLQIQQSGKGIFMNLADEKLTTAGILYYDELEKYSGRELLVELRKTLIGRDVRVPTLEGAQPFINLDNSASTPTFAPIWNTFRQTWRLSGHINHEIIHEVKSICAGVLGAPQGIYDVIFTSNTTEAINLAAESLSRKTDDGTEPVILNTLLEHSSNDLPWRMVPNCSLIRLSVDEDGFIDLNELDTLLSAYNQKVQYGNKRIKLVAVSGASNVLGVCNNLEEISRTVHQYGARLLVDAAQLVAHRKVNMEGCGIDYLAFSAHKVYAPFGCGVLVVRKGLLNFNNTELQLIQSSGEENAGGIAALGKALVLLQRIGMDVIREEEQALTAQTLRGLGQIHGLTIYGIKNPESPGFPQKLGVVVFGLKNMMPGRVAKELALQSGIGVRYGCHCAHIIIKHLLRISPFLERFQRLIQTLFPRLRLPGLVRMSLGIENSEEDVDRLIQVLNQVASPSRDIADRNIATGKKVAPMLRQAEVQQQMNDFAREITTRVYSQL